MIVTPKCFEDNPLVGDYLGQPGKGRILVMDGGGSLRCAILGDILAQKAVHSGEHVTFARITFRPGDWLYADPDGIVVLPEQPK